MSDIAGRVTKIVVEHLGVDETKVVESASFITGATLHINGGMGMF